MQIIFPRLYRTERKAEHCAVSLPLTRGAFRDGMGIRVLDQEQELPVQFRALSRYPDGSVKFLQVRFEADLPGNRGKTLRAEITEQAGPIPEGIRVRQEEGLIRVDGGPGGLRFSLREGTDALVDSLEDGRITYRKEQFIGPRLKDGEGKEYLPRYETWRILEEGPLTLRLRGEGRLISGASELSGEGARFETGITLWRGKPWMEVSFRLINATDGPLEAAGFEFGLTAEGKAFDSRVGSRTLRERGDSVGEGSVAKGHVIREGEISRTTGLGLLGELEKRYAGGPVRCCVGRSNYRTNFTFSAGTAVEETVDTAGLMNEANEHFPEVFYGTFFADRTDREGGVCATVYQAQQNYPKAVKSDESGIYVLLIPEGIEKVVFQSGMSREQRFLLHFHGPEEPMAEIDNRSLIYQMPDRPYLPMEAYRDAGAGMDIFVPPEKSIPDVENSLISRCDAHSCAYGLLNFGDAPDMGYTLQGRGKGELVWTNNEYDFPHACALLYMRTGERRFLDYAIAAGRHWMDVDVCHYSKDPLRIGGQWEHSRKHVLDSTMVCSHEWVEGLLDLYHLTGEDRAKETALGIGENVLRLLETPAYQTRGESNARETGWALRSLTALYLETGDDKWLKRAGWIVENFRAWRDEYGGWVAAYTDNTQIHTPFMIAVAMGSLYRYYQVFPDEQLKQLILDAADDLLENAMTPTGLFYYKGLPSLNRQGTNTLVLEALTIAWKLSGNAEYLRKGLFAFRKDIAIPSKTIGHKTVREGWVVLENESPKGFAQSFIPLAVYYKAATDAGIL